MELIAGKQVKFQTFTLNYSLSTLCHGEMIGAQSKVIPCTDASSSCANLAETNVSSDVDVIVVRGRTRDSSKSATFNQLWTYEEQQR